MDNHPTIDIISSPAVECPRPVWNCIEYCFRTNDYITQVGTQASIIVSFGPENYADGISIDVAGYIFTTATPGGVNSFSWQGTAQQIAINFAAMLNAHYYLGCNFHIEVPDAFPTLVVIVAYETGEQPNWGATFPVTIPPGLSVIQGDNHEVRPNYRFVLEAWKCEDGQLVSKIVTHAYEPVVDEVCIDISRIVNKCVSTTFPGLNAMATIVYDDTIMQEICLRYGEIYAQTLFGCDSEAQFFERATPIRVINSAFQKDDDLGIDKYCWTPSEAAMCFLNSRPDWAEVCVDSFAWLWYNYDEVVQDIIDMFAPVQSGVRIEFNYTDGTSDDDVIGPLTNPGILIVPAGLAQLSSLADPAKTVLSYSVQMVMVTAFPLVVPLSQAVIFKVADSGFCCCHEEFYFLGEPGGYETILFNCLRETDLQYSYTDFVGYEKCEGDLLKGGKAEIEANAYDVFRTTSRFTDNYENLAWLRQFFKSPIRLWRKDGKVYKIVLTTDEIPLYRKDGFIYIEIEYILSFELNQQSN